MTNQEITLRIVRQELGKMLQHIDCGRYQDHEVLETLIDRIVDLNNFIDNSLCGTLDNYGERR